jgi:transmembrane sensor
MNRPHTVPDPETEDQASLWAARLEGSTLGAAERAELEAWLAGGPDRREALARFCRFSAELDRIVPALVESGSIEVRHEDAPRRAAFNPWKLATAGLVAAALAVAVVRLAWPGMRPETLVAPAGERQTFTLADGTRVELNANTTMVVENGSAERRVRLANGEAFFSVSKDKARPFIVETPAGSVRVTGTKFDVLTEAASQLEVTVVEGSVQVRPGDGGGAAPSGTAVLGPGDRLTREGAGFSTGALSSDDVEDALAWRQGQIVCKGIPLSEALSQFAHYHGLVMTASPGAARSPVGGRYPLNDLNGFLEQLEQGSLHLRVVRAPDGAVHVSLPGEP